MSRRDVRERGEYPLPPPSKCAKVLYYTWKLCSVVFSHFVMISLVVAYCILGAVTFEKLESQYEREVKMNISQLRRNTTHSIWAMTNRSAVLIHSNWTSGVVDMLKDFENAILLEMKVRGWDGNEDPSHIQWTFTGALFYSIIVITTIGYGHIAPKTQSGKVVTIFYAILGIPLMLLTLSNIGDVMATSFRFLYWRVCCYVCTRPPKRRHRHHHASTRRSVKGGSGRGSMRRRRPALPAPALERAHSDTDCRYRDSGYSSGHVRRPRPERAPPAPHAHTLPHRHTLPPPRTRSQPPHAHILPLAHMPLAQTLPRANTLPHPRTRSQPPQAHWRGHSYNYKHHEEEQPQTPQYDHHDRFDHHDRSDHHDKFDHHDRSDHIHFDVEELEFPKVSLPLEDLEAALKDLEMQQMKISKQELRSKSLPRPAKSKPDYDPKKGFDDYRLFKDDDDVYEMHDLHDVDFENYKERKAREVEDGGRRGGDRDFYGYRDRPPKSALETDLPSFYGYDPEDEDYEFDSIKPRISWRDRDRSNRGRSEYYERDREDNFDSRGRRARSAVYDHELRWDDEPRRDREPEPGRRRRLRRLQTVDETVQPPYRYTPSPERDDWSDDVGAPVPRRGRPPGWEVYPVQPEPSKDEIKPVPIWLCVFLVASYIVAGTFLFKRWENWAYLDAAYFCFITLTTIGFGDFVPAQGQSQAAGLDAADAVHSIALCSLYLLFGIALLAMSFNLVQEEVRANVAELATKLGIIKPKQTDSESEE